MMYRRRRKLSPEETAANLAHKQAREAAAMTCQCCGRKYLANTGVIAHHAFERPGTGWQTPSCMGARELPFEVSRDQLGLLLVYLREHEKHMVEWRKAVADETSAIALTYTDYDAPYQRGVDRPVHRFTITRATYDAVKAQHQSAFNRISAWYSFDQIKERDLDERDTNIKNIRHKIKTQQKRYDEWQQTYSGWDTRGKWVKL